MYLYDGPRKTMDTCRMVQHGSWTGQINIENNKIDINPEKFIGTRDRSWGVRPVGAYDSQPPVPMSLPQFYWLWNPAHFDDFTTQFHFVDDSEGNIVNGHSILQYKNKREKLLSTANDKNLSAEDRFEARLKLAQLPRNSSKNRIRNRCLITGRPRGVYRKFGLSRIAFRDLASDGKLPGVVKSSW